LEGDEVMTIYGRGFVEKKRLEQQDVVVKLRNWRLAQQQSPTCYLHESACIKIPSLIKGSIVKTTWGLVRILDILRNGQHICEHIHWQLAQGQPPIMYSQLCI
jgi:hypothetical protein